jgi:peptidoglycan/xylan/chitin deacetylase (PgdA/CDA1 family)
MSINSFWGIEPSTALTADAGPVVARWEAVGLRCDDAFPVDLPEPLWIVVPERRILATGQPLLRGRLRDGREVTLAVRQDDGRVTTAFDLDLAVRALIALGQYTERRPYAARLPFSYRRVPASVRNLIRNLLTRRQALTLDARCPMWPVEPSVETMRRIYLGLRRIIQPGLTTVPFWPAGKRFAIALTHDVDSAEGLRTARGVAREETDCGHRSCWFVVGRDYPLDRSALEDLRGVGSELGLHGVHHDNRLPFLTADRVAQELDACRADIEALKMRGFRSPSMLRTPILYAMLEGRFAYDSSMPDTGLLPSRNGCRTVFPFAHRRIIVLPLTLPPDGQLLALGLSPANALAAWIAKTEWIASVGGVAMCLTHPERGFSAEQPMRETYRGFMDWVSSREDAWRPTPAEMVDWWSRRSA